MNFAHLHIVLNHVPVLGTMAGVVLFIASLYKKNEELKRFSLLIFVSMAILVLPTYLSGNGAQRLIQGREEIPEVLIEAHQNVAILAFLAMTISGTLAWFGLWQIRRTARMGTGGSMAILLFSILTSMIIFRAANLGGKISHPEVRYDQEIVEVTAWRSAVESFVWGDAWVWPAVETLHFVGMTLVFGVVLLLNLRMLGMMKSIPFVALHRLLPVAILGFILNVITGMIFFMASPGGYLVSTAFIIKVLLMVFAGFLTLYFTVFDGPWSVGAGKDAPFVVKATAVVTTIVVLGVMYFGRVIPFM